MSTPSKSLDEMLAEMDAKATPGLWNSDLGWIDGNGLDVCRCYERKADSGIAKINGNLIVSLRNALPALRQYVRAAKELRALDISPLYGAHAAWARDGNSEAAKMLDDRDERIHVCVHAYDAAEAALLRALEGNK